MLLGELMSTEANHGDTPNDRLRHAYIARSADQVKAALAAGANPNLEVDGSPVLCGAAFIADLEMLEALLAAGANVNARGIFGMTAVMFIAWGKDTAKHMQALQRLIDAGADLSLKSPEGFTALDFSKVFPNTPAMDVLQRNHAPRGRSPKGRDDSWHRG